MSEHWRTPRDTEDARIGWGGAILFGIAFWSLIGFALFGCSPKPLTQDEIFNLAMQCVDQKLIPVAHGIPIHSVTCDASEPGERA